MSEYSERLTRQEQTESWKLKKVSKTFQLLILLYPALDELRGFARHNNSIGNLAVVRIDLGHGANEKIRDRRGDLRNIMSIADMDNRLCVGGFPDGLRLNQFRTEVGKKLSD